MSEERTRELLDRRSFEERVFARFDAMEARSISMETRFDGLNARFDAIETRFDAMETRFDGVETRLDSLDVRFQMLKAKALDTRPIWERALVEILEIRKGVEDINRKLDVLNQDVLQVRADQRRVEKRMDELTSRAQ